MTNQNNNDNTKYYEIDVPEKSLSYLAEVKDANLTDLVVVESLGSQAKIVYNVADQEPFVAESEDDYSIYTDYEPMNRYLNHPWASFCMKEIGGTEEVAKRKKEISKYDFYETSADGLISQMGICAATNRPNTHLMGRYVKLKSYLPLDNDKAKEMENILSGKLAEDLRKEVGSQNPDPYKMFQAYLNRERSPR